MEKIYLYLGKRDKKGVKVLTVFSGSKLPRSRVEDVKSLHLPDSLEIGLIKTIFDNRLEWEVWIESAKNFGELKDRLNKRGYKHIPMHTNSIYPQISKAIPDISGFAKKSKTMLQRNKINQ
jgi:hypothetical protein